MEIDSKEYNDETIKIAQQLAIRPELPPDAKIIQEALQRKLLETYGFDLNNFNLVEVCIKLCQKIDDIKTRMSNLQLQLNILKQKKITVKKFITILKKNSFFTKDQIYLFQVLSSCKPTEDSKIIAYIKKAKKTNRWTTENLKSLVKSTKKRILKWEDGSKMIQIKPLRGKPFNGYQLILNFPLLKS